MFVHHSARHWIDRRLTDRQHQAWTRHGADAFTGDELDARRWHQPHLAIQQRTVGHVRIVAGIFEGTGLGAQRRAPAELQAHLHLTALGQRDAHCIHRLAAQ